MMEEPKICSAADRNGQPCVLKEGHDGRHRNQFDEEWAPGAVGAREPEQTPNKK